MLLRPDADGICNQDRTASSNRSRRVAQQLVEVWVVQYPLEIRNVDVWVFPDHQLAAPVFCRQTLDLLSVKCLSEIRSSVSANGLCCGVA